MFQRTILTDHRVETKYAELLRSYKLKVLNFLWAIYYDIENKAVRFSKDVVC